MPKKFIKKYIPKNETLKKHKYLQFFGRLLHDENLWHLNRHSVSRAMGIGLFCAYLPIPFQMVVAVALAMVTRANVPISVVLVWITNPLTMPPMFYFAYKVGSWTLGRPPRSWNVEISFSWILEQIHWIWLPTLIGSLICATTLSLLGYFGTKLMWRWWLIRQMRKRQRKYRKQENAS